MPLLITRQDITKMNVDVIVNAANRSLLGGGGVDGAIHRAAGAELLKECITLGGCETSNAKITSAYKLPCKNIVHTVGPIWRGGSSNEENLLKSCYKNPLILAKEISAKSVAFPLISAGAYGFPKEKALKIARETILEFLKDTDLTVYIVIFDKEVCTISKKLFDNVSQFIDDRYVINKNMRTERKLLQECTYYEDEKCALSLTEKLQKPLQSLDNLLVDIDDTFTQRLLSLIDIKNKTDVEVYKKANIDRKLFSKIRSNIDYQPKKTTVLSFCFALELSLDETKDLLNTAGFALSRSSKFDVIIEYFITNEIYDIFEVNETLFAFDQKILS